MGKVLYYGLTDKERRDLMETGGEAWEYREVFSEELSETIKTLVEGEAQGKTTGEEGAFLLFSEPDRSALKTLLVELGKKGYPFPHKAIVTETTKEWTFQRWMGHIREEHAMVVAYTKLGALVKKLGEEGKDQDPEIAALIEEGRRLPQTYGEDLTEEIIGELEGRLRRLLEE